VSNKANEQEEQRLAALARSHKRGRFILAALAILAPVALHALFERQALRLDALGDHGRPATATIAAIDREGADGTVAYEYAVDGARYAWSVKSADAPGAPGQTFPISYLPEDPSLSRPGVDGAGAKREAASNRSFAHKIELGVFLFFALNLGLLEWKARKLKQKQRSLISVRTLGRVFALLLIGGALAADLSPEVRPVFVKAFGEAPFGVPVVPLVCVVNVLLLVPYFWVGEHLMRIVMQAVADRASISRGGIVVAVLFAHRARPELSRSRNVVLAGFGYFVVLLGAWIAYAESRGL
jgi:hypothetical protein